MNPKPISAANRHAARGTIQLMLGRMSFFAFGYFVAIVIARGLGPVEYGVYGVILSVLVWIEQMGRFGVPEAVTKLIPEDEGRASRVEHTAQTVLLVVFLLLFVLFWVASPMLAHIFKIPEGTSLFRLAILDVPVSGIYFAYQGILTGRRNFGALSGGLAVYGFTKLVGISIAWFLGLSIFWALIVNILGTVAALLFLAAHIGFKGFRPSCAHMKSILHLAFPVGLCFLAAQVLSNLDLWSLKVVGSEAGETVGNYVAALNIARVPALVFAVVNGVVLPSISMALAQQNLPLARRYVQGAGRFLWVTLLPSCVLIALTAQDLMVFLFSNRYAAGASFLVLQVFGFALFGVAHVFSEMLIARGNAYVTAGATLAIIPMAVFLNLILIPHFGAIGASVALALTAFVRVAVTGHLVFQRLGPLIETSTFAKVLLATAFMALVCTQMPGAGFWLLPKYLFLLGLYGLALVVVGELTWYDLQPFALWRREQA